MLVLGLKDPDPLSHTFDWWMVRLAGGPPVRCPVNSAELAVPFAWLGDDVYFERGVGEAGTGIRRLRIDRKTWQPVGSQEDLAVGTSDALTPSPARDGRVVFAAIAKKTNIWSLPLDANRGKVTGTPKAITNDLGENIVHSISADGKRVAFTATQILSGGGAQVWGADLETGQLHALTNEGQPKSAAEISPDGQQIAWRVALLTAEDIFTTPFGGGAAAKLCSDCTGRMAWSPDGRFALLAQSPPSRTMRLLELATGREIDYLNLKGTNLRPFPASFSPDGNWLAFRVDRPQSDYSVQVAPFRPEEPPPDGEWKPILTAADGSRQVRWSPDGNLVYFSSARDGFNCLWAQRLHSVTKMREGKPFTVQHYHSPAALLAAPSMSQPPAVAIGKVVVSVREQSSNLWLWSPRK
jgi:dipeptidyl aminopeptidase/acylaminoacyl peptidase